MDKSAMGSLSGLGAEEQLFIGIANGPLEQYKDFLESLEDVDVRLVRQRTLLHLGVQLRKLDWVEGLLGSGADPCLRDSDGVTALALAKEMIENFPENGDCREILKLVRLVHKRDSAIKRRLAFHGVNISGQPLPALSRETAELSTIKDSLNALNAGMASFRNQITQSIQEVKRSLSDGNVLLEYLETAVTLSAEVVREMKECMEETFGARSVQRSVLPTDVRRECIDRMIDRTIILNGEKGKVAWVRSMYEKMYDGGEMMSCLVRFLEAQSQVKVIIDGDSTTIGSLKAQFMDYDGTMWNGNQRYSFSDYLEFRVYIGGKVDSNRREELVFGSLVWSFARMSLLFAFQNKGRPYERNDGIHEIQCKRVIEEAEEKRKGGFVFNEYIRYALDMKTLLGKEIEFVSAVPGVIAIYGLTAGISMLHEEVPTLLDFFKDHVMTTLLHKARVSTAVIPGVSL